MEHTYLRYECADSFGLVTSAGAATSSRAPVGDKTLQVLHRGAATSLLTTAGSNCALWNAKTGQLSHKLGHAEFSGIGTGRALNNTQVLCLDVGVSDTDGTNVVATGWLDGAVRVFDGLDSGSPSFSLFRIGSEWEDDQDQERPDPLTLNGHSPHPVTAICLNGTTRLASGGSDGTVIVWDLIAESGLFRLLGHQRAVSQLHFLSEHQLLSCSLDGLVKVWDLNAQCCIQTMANTRGEIWASTYLTLKEEEDTQRRRFLAGSMDGQVRVWDVEPNGREEEEKKGDDDMETDGKPSSLTKDDICLDMGLLEAPVQHLATSSSKSDTSAVMSRERVHSIRSSPYSRHVAFLQANAKLIHIYSIRSVKESTRKRQRRLKRRQEKQAKKDKAPVETKKKKKRGMLDDEEDHEEEEGKDDTAVAQAAHDPTLLRASDEFEYCGAIKASHKVKSFVFLPPKSVGTTKAKPSNAKKTIVKLACALSTNTIEIYSLEKEKEATAMTRPSSEKLSNLTPLYGHPTGVRSMVLSSDDEEVATISKGVCKIWSVSDRSCLQSVALEEPVHPSKQSSKHSSHAFQGLCATFLPGNSHVVVGTKEGHLVIIDKHAAEIVYWEEKAHDDAIWSIDIWWSSKDDSICNIVTGGADKMVKFWALEPQGEDSDDDSEDEEEVLFPGAPKLVPTRVLEMTDEVVAVKYSLSLFAKSKKRMVFVSTLDCTIKVFFDDSLKLFLSLYGHKLPALAVDASDDDTLLVSGSADKTIKLHGLDWGDTHKTLHGHTDSVTDVKFVRRTHYFFSASKDGTVRYWDGDRFQQVLVLRGHNAEVNCLVVSATNSGAVCLSGGMDRQVRVWERTKDIVFLEEERERELEQMFDDDPSKTRREEGGTASILDRKGTGDGDGEDGDAMKQDEPQSEAAVKRSVMSINAGDRLLEALELADQELQASRSKSKKAASRTANPMLMGMDPPKYVLWVLKSIKPVDLEQALLVLPLGHAERLLYYIVLLLRDGTRSVELCCNAAVSTFKAHQNQILLPSNQQAMAPLLRELRRLMQLRLKEFRDTLGYNLAACRMIGRIAQEQKDSKMLSLEPSTDIWAGLGIGSDVAAALEGKSSKGGKR